MPTPEESSLVLAHHQYDTSQFTARKATAVLETNRVQPHLGAIGIALNVDVGRLVPIAGEEEAAVRADTKDGGHLER
jgi:hypothetical protein